MQFGSSFLARCQRVNRCFALNERRRSGSFPLRHTAPADQYKSRPFLRRTTRGRSHESSNVRQALVPRRRSKWYACRPGHSPHCLAPCAPSSAQYDCPRQAHPCIAPALRRRCRDEPYGRGLLGVLLLVLVVGFASLVSVCFVSLCFLWLRF